MRLSRRRDQRLLGLPVAVHQRDDVDRDVVSRSQPVVGYPPATVPQHSSRPHHQVLGRHGVPGGNQAVRTLSTLTSLYEKRRSLEPVFSQTHMAGTPVNLRQGLIQNCI